MYLQHNYKSVKKRKAQVNKNSALRALLRRYATHIKFTSVILVIGFFTNYLYVLYVNNKPLNVNHVQVFGATNFVDEHDFRGLVSALVMYENILFINTSDLQDNLLSTFQGAKDVKVSKVYPATIQVDVYERIPMAIVTHPDTDEYYLVDEDGYILGVVALEEDHLPVINYTGDLKVGFFIDKKLVPLYLSMLTTINQENLKVSSISISDDHITFFLFDVIKVYIGSDKDIVNSIRTVSELYKQKPNLIEDVKRIDLRYDKVIVEYEAQ